MYISSQQRENEAFFWCRRLIAINLSMKKIFNTSFKCVEYDIMNLGLKK